MKLLQTIYYMTFWEQHPYTLLQELIFLGINHRTDLYSDLQCCTCSSGRHLSTKHYNMKSISTPIRRLIDHIADITYLPTLLLWKASIWTSTDKSTAITAKEQKWCITHQVLPTELSCILVHGILSKGGRSTQILLHGSISEHLSYCGLQCEINELGISMQLAWVLIHVLTVLQNSV